MKGQIARNFKNRIGVIVFEGRSEDDDVGSGWNGLLVTQDLEDETASLEEQADNPVTILQASELETDLERILHEILSVNGCVDG